jgi:hypothetical protein
LYAASCAGIGARAEAFGVGPLADFSSCAAGVAESGAAGIPLTRIIWGLSGRIHADNGSR